MHDFHSGVRDLPHPADVAMKLGRPLNYDPAKRIVTGDAEATKLLQRAYRAPWQRPALG